MFAQDEECAPIFLKDFLKTVQTTTLEARGLAVFIDIENLIGSANGMGVPVRPDLLLDKIKELGPIRLRKAYGDMTNVLNSTHRGSEINELRRRFQRALVEMIDIPHITQFKNTADMHLAIDALSVAFQNPEITHYAIVSSDRDYVPLYNKLRELGKSVIAVGIDPENTNTMIREASDVLFFYSDLFPPDSIVKTPLQQAEAVPSAVDPELIKDYYSLMGRSLRVLESKGRPLVGTEVVQQMRALRSDFDPRRAGFQNFKELVRQAQKDHPDLEVILPDGPGDMVFSPSSVSFYFSEPSATTPLSSAEQNNVALLESKIREILKVNWPKREQRHIILEQVAKSYKHLMKSGPFKLGELAKDAQTNLIGQDVDQGAAYKITLSLYIARCFNISPTAEKLNPEIVGRIVPEEEWDDRIVTSVLSKVAKALPELDAQTAAYVIYGPDADQVEVRQCKLILEESKT